MTDLDMESARKRRVMDTSSGALITARAERPLSSEDRRNLCKQCEEVAGVCRDARVALLERLMDAPRMVVSHSRVSDAEGRSTISKRRRAQLLRRLEMLNLQGPTRIAG